MVMLKDWCRGGQRCGWLVRDMWRSDIGALTRGRRGSEGYGGARLGRLPLGVTTRLGLPPGQDGDEGVVHSQKKYASAGGKLSVADFPRYIH